VCVASTSTTTGDTSLFDTLLSAEIKKADAFHKAREDDLLQLFSALIDRSVSYHRFR
jgi:Trk K+ transport system NAD-binding subunit